MAKPVIGTVPYLNTRPLVRSLEGPDAPVHLVEAVPSELARMLDRREVAAAFVSSVVPLSDPRLCVLDVAAVASEGPVRSIRLFSRVPVRRIESVALDTSSRTSVILCRLLLKTVYGLSPRIVSLPPDLPRMLEAADSGLLIGDPALRAAVSVEAGCMPEVVEDLDLGAVWTERTGLPFVFAVWAAPADADNDELTIILRDAAAWGHEHLMEIADSEAERLGLPREMCRSYLTENIRHSLGPREWEGMRRFHSEAVELGLLPPRPTPVGCR